MSTPIKGFGVYGGRYRAHVTLERDHALAIAAEAERRSVSVAEVLRDVMRAGLRRGLSVSTRAGRFPGNKESQ